MDVSIGYGDSILVDSDSEKENAKDEVQLGLRSKKSYLMEYRNLSEEDAEKELEQIRNESPVEMDYFGISDREGEENNEEEKDRKDDERK